MTQNKVLGATGVLLTLVGFSGLIFGGINATLKSSGAYGQGLARAVGDARVQAALGAPVNPGWLVTGSVKANPSKSTAFLQVPLEGAMRTGSLSISAEKQSADWEFRILKVDVAGKPSIDLLAD